MKEGHQLESLFEKYDMVFKEDLGTLQSATATLHVKPNATFKFFKPHPVPYAIRESVELELDRLESKTKWKVILVLFQASLPECKISKLQIAVSY